MQEKTYIMLEKRDDHRREKKTSFQSNREELTYHRLEKEGKSYTKLSQLICRQTLKKERF